MLPERRTGSNLRFTLHTALTWLAIVAFVMGWYATTKRLRTRNDLLVQQMFAARNEVRLAESRAEFRADVKSLDNPRGNRARPRARFEGVDMRGVVIQAGDSAFQLAVFDNADLSEGSLTGGAASFQGASFNNAILKNAKLAGGVSSFQLATFQDADLTGAVLRGHLQEVSLKNAKCVGATIDGSFQGANIDNAQFQSANLSALSSDDLAGCYYDTPPIFNLKTKFPDGFNPVAQGWKLDRASRP